MPKEMFYDRPAGVTYNAAAGQHDVVAPDGLHLKVGWDDTYPRVEVGVQVNSVDADPEHHGMYVQLDRDQINGVIRALRRARDRVFGSD